SAPPRRSGSGSGSTARTRWRRCCCRERGCARGTADAAADTRTPRPRGPRAPIERAPGARRAAAGGGVVSRVVLLFLLSLCAACRDSVSEPGRVRRASPEEFGAAAFVPADAACFASLRAPAQLVRDIAASRAFAELSQLPSVRGAMQQWQQSAAM